jgi:hypothetical protein
MKYTLYSRFIDSVRPYLREGYILDSQLKKVLQSLHCSAVASSICNGGPNTVLGRWAPPIAEEEKSLLGIICTAFSQFRCNKSIRLKNYQHRIGKSEDDVCLECRVAPHKAPHLFDCPSHPTDLGYEDLWYHPRVAALFLSSVPICANFPPCGPSSPCHFSGASTLNFLYYGLNLPPAKTTTTTASQRRHRHQNGATGITTMSLG